MKWTNILELKNADKKMKLFHIPHASSTLIQEAIEFMAEQHLIATADAQVRHITEDMREQNLLVAEAFALAFAHLHASYYPNLVNKIPGIHQERTESTCISLSKAQLDEINQRLSKVATEEDSVHIFTKDNITSVLLLSPDAQVVPITTFKS
jgi:hypothetical protein